MCQADCGGGHVDIIPSPHRAYNPVKKTEKCLDNSIHPQFMSTSNLRM